MVYVVTAGEKMGTSKLISQRTILAVLAVAAVLVAVSCGSDDDGRSGPLLPSGRTQAPSAPEDAGPVSKQAARFLAGVDGKYTYRYTGPIGDATEGKLVIVRLGVKDRWDWSSSPYGFEVTTITIMGEDENYVCTISGEFNACREAATSELESLRYISSPIYDALADLVAEHDKYEVDDLPDETYGGLTGKCYQAFSNTRIGQGAPASEDIKACFANDGVVTYFSRTTTPDSAALEPGTFAIELLERVDAALSDFEPTATVQ